VAHVISLPATAGQSFPSGKTVQEWLRDIALPVSGQSNPQAVGALTALHMAMDWLLCERWNWYENRAATFDTVVGTADYVVPTNTRSIKNMRVTVGDLRPITYFDPDLYDRVIFDQSGTDLPRYFSTRYLPTEAVITLHPTPSAVETIQMNVDVDPIKESNGLAVLDVATWMERPLVLHAQGLVVKWRGGQGGLSVQLVQMAEDALQDALRRDRDEPDAVPRLLSQFEHETQRYPWDHPLHDRSY